MNALIDVLGRLGLSNGAMERLDLCDSRPAWHFKCGLTKFEQQREKLREGFSAIGYCPIMVGVEKDWVEVESRFDASRYKVIETIAAAQEISGQRWLQESAALHPDLSTRPIGRWPSDVGPCDEFTQIHMLRQRECTEPVHIIALPTTHSYEVPAYLGFGDHDECPTAAVHVALFKRWHTLFGVEIAIVTSNTIGAAVRRPPVERSAALELAMEHAVYCPPVIYEATEEISVLAAMLFKGTRWTFWWNELSQTKDISQSSTYLGHI